MGKSEELKQFVQFVVDALNYKSSLAIHFRRKLVEHEGVEFNKDGRFYTFPNGVKLSEEMLFLGDIKIVLDKIIGR